MTHPIRIAWTWEDGLDSATFLTDPVTGNVTLQGNRRMGMMQVDYTVIADASFTALSVAVQSAAHAFHLTRHPDGWHDTTGLIPGTIDAIDPDISCTAFTNTLPIRRLSLAPGASETITALYLDADDWTIRTDRQRYTRTPEGYVYEGLSTGFRAEFTVDNMGLVLDYPGLCSRWTPAD